MKKLELVGKRFGKLIVVKEIDKRKSEHILWECVCDCGNKIMAYSSNLTRGKTKSCGCLVKKHGMNGTPTYKTWQMMIQRCNNPNDTGYEYYGGRGITVCESWLKFESFFKDMGKRPSGLTIERIDNEKGYYPNNCKWATATEQQLNKRISKNNTSGYRGVCYDKSRNKYEVRIKTNHIRIYIGRFVNKQDAIIARKQAEQRYRS